MFTIPTKLILIIAGLSIVMAILGLAITQPYPTEINASIYYFAVQLKQWNVFFPVNTLIQICNLMLGLELALLTGSAMLWVIRMGRNIAD